MDLRQSSESPDPPSLCDDASRSIWRPRMTKSAQLMIPSPFMSIRRSNPSSDLRSPIFLLNSFASAASDLPSPLDGDPSPGPSPTRGGVQCPTCRLPYRKLPICGTRLDILNLRDIHSRVIGASLAGAREKTGRVFFPSPSHRWTISRGQTGMSAPPSDTFRPQDDRLCQDLTDRFRQWLLQSMSF